MREVVRFWIWKVNSAGFAGLTLERGLVRGRNRDKLRMTPGLWPEQGWAKVLSFTEKGNWFGGHLGGFSFLIIV